MGKEFVKFGAGHATAMLRLGAKELQAALVNPGANIAQPTELGTFLAPTPGEIADGKATDDRPFFDWIGERAPQLDSEQEKRQEKLRDKPITLEKE